MPNAVLHRPRTRLTLIAVCFLACLFFLLWNAGIQAQEAIPTETSQAEAAAQPPEAHPPSDHSGEGEEEHGGDGHADPVVPVLFEIAIVLIAAKLAGHVAAKFNQPSVLGELIIGMLIGAITLLPARAGLPLDNIQHLIDTAREEGSYLDILARIGVVLLLFEVGLETSINEMRRVGVLAFLVALVGVIAPFGLGYGVSHFMIKTPPPGMDIVHVHMFIGATLCATSVGITARVFQDLMKLQTKEAKVILGAAVIDDVMGLVILAVVSGIIMSDLNGVEQSLLQVATVKTIGALLFLAASVFVGLKIAPYGFRFMSRLKGAGMLVASALAFCFLLSALANKVGLATIVGAFAAGLVLEEAHIRPFLGTRSSEGTSPVMYLGHQLHPVSTLLVPIFFVLMGIQVRLDTFAQVEVLILALALTVAAIVGKQVCGLPVKGSWASKLTVGFGMIPRGEVGLIFAAIGRSLGVVNDGVYAAVVIMVILTTLITPPLLKVSMSGIEPETT